MVARALITAFCGTATMMIAQETLAQTTGSTLQRVEVTGGRWREGPGGVVLVRPDAPGQVVGVTIRRG